MIVRSCSLLSPTRLRFAKAPSPASGRGKNHTPRILKRKMENNKRRWLWVPAFAGTTRGEWVPQARCAPSPALAGEGRGGGKPQTTVFVGKRLRDEMR